MKTLEAASDDVDRQDENRVWGIDEIDERREKQGEQFGFQRKGTTRVSAQKHESQLATTVSRWLESEQDSESTRYE